MRILDLTGSPEAMGHTHGKTYAEEIQAYAEDRIALAGTEFWAGGEIDKASVLEIAESTLPAHQAHSPDLYAEMCALAEGAGTPPAEAVVVGGFTDFVDTVRSVVTGAHPDPVVEDDCTAFIVPNQRGVNGQGLYGQTWDMHDSATEHVVLLRLRPQDAPAALVFSTVGCLGQIGMNEAGVCVGINNLTATDGGPGVMWPSVVRAALATESADQALQEILTADLAGAHSFLIFDKSGAGYMVEAMPSKRPYATLDQDALIHTNHVLWDDAQLFEGAKNPLLKANSEKRHQEATKLLDRHDLTPQDLMAVTRHPEAICQISSEPFHLESSGGAIMRPATGDFWAVWGVPSHNDYQHIPFHD